MTRHSALWAVVAGLAVSAEASANSYRLYMNEYLFPGQRLTRSCYYHLDMQSDRNLVVYGGRSSVWASRTNNAQGGYAVMQTDGNFVIYNWADAPVWSTRTHGHGGAFLEQQDDSNLVVYNWNRSRALWNAGTGGGEPIGQTPCRYPPAKTRLEFGWNRPGGDYLSVDLTQPRSSWCAYYCSQDPNCAAFTYVPPGVQGPAAKCWLKNTMPTMVYQPGMVSGVVVR